MYNSESPLSVELPSSRQLLRSTILAAIAAVVILITTVLPADYGIDPTGVGRILRLTEMGEIKTRLAAEAAADAAASRAALPGGATAPADSAKAVQQATPQPQKAASSEATPTAVWRHEQRYTISPGQGIEVKLAMKAGEVAQFDWTAEDEKPLNYDAHGDAPGRSVSYAKGRGVPSDRGELVAAFTGNHGWFWRNRNANDVVLVLRTRGEYSTIKRAL